MSPGAGPFDALLDLLPRTSLVVGKGGVGKTTCAVAIADAFARRGDHTLLVSTDPAAALSTVLGAPVTTTAAPVTGRPQLDAWQLSADELRRAFLDRWRDTIAAIVDRGTYLDNDDVGGLVDAAFPGSDEIFAVLALADLLADSSMSYARIIIDTAPTGHTLRLLALPDTFRALLALLDRMQDRHRFMVRALTRRYRRDAADDFLDDLRRRIDGLRTALADAAATAAVLVTRAEPVVVAETVRYADALTALHVAIAALVVNALPAERDAAAADALSRLTVIGPSIPRLFVSRWTDAEQASVFTKETSHLSNVSRDVSPAPLTSAALTIVGGKGGVGKTTVACALAIAAADEGRGPILLVSTDPAPSVADALGEPDAAWAAADVEHALAEVPGLTVRQMNAAAAFARFRDEYHTRIDALFETLVGRGIDVEQDRAILRDLLAFAPPGVDELFALSILSDALADGRFARVIVDPAPTGHLLRLLDMPALALDWTHRLMRLMLKYRDAVSLGDAAQELLDVARRTRALDALLHDRGRCELILVTLDEPVVRAESARLAAAVGERGIAVPAMVWNRLRHAPAPLPAAPPVRQFFAGERTPPPVGVAALRDWRRGWREPSVP